MQSDAWDETFYKLLTSNTEEGDYNLNSESGSVTVYWGIRVWKLHNGVETEITAGTPVAQVSRSENGSGIQSNTYTPNQTPLDTTDTIIVRVYIKFGSGSWVLAASFKTDALGATQLDSVEWTVYYYTVRAYYAATTRGQYNWGYSGTESKITNFTWSVAAAVIGKRLLLGVGK